MKQIYDYPFDEMEAMLLEKGMKKYRATQIYDWLYRKRATSFSQMSNLNKDTRAMLMEEYDITAITLVEKQVSSDATTKFLFALADGAYIETVLMVLDYGNSVCVSSQVGCNMGCAFCASGLLKKQRNLQTSEMVAQVMAVQRELDKIDQRVSHIVVMGTGEPFDNYENVMKFIKIVNHDWGLAIGSRHITVSTCGIVPKIYEFSHSHFQYNLAISLHAPNDALRNELMPINKAYPLAVLKEALKTYCEENNRRLTIEYIVLKDVNDQKEHARQLAKFLKGINAYVNLIPYNSVAELGFKGVDKGRLKAFENELVQYGARVTIRKEHGSDIDAACGQLRAKELKKG